MLAYKIRMTSFKILLDINRFERMGKVLKIVSTLVS